MRFILTLKEQFEEKDCIDISKIFLEISHFFYRSNFF